MQQVQSKERHELEMKILREEHLMKMKRWNQEANLQKENISPETDIDIVNND